MTSAAQNFANRQAHVGFGGAVSVEQTRRRMKTVNCIQLSLLLGCVLCLRAGLDAAKEMPGTTQRACAKVTGFAIAPNGRSVAEILAGCRNEKRLTRVVVRHLDGVHGSGRVLYAATGVEQVIWMDNDKVLFVKSEDGSVVEEMNVASGRRTVLLNSHHAVVIRGWEAQRRLLMISYERNWRWKGRRSVRVRDSMSTLQFIEPRWARVPQQLVRVYNVGRGIAKRVVRIHLTMSKFEGAPVLTWRKGEPIALVPSGDSFRTRIFNLVTGQRIDPPVPLFNLSAIAVSRNGRMAVASTRLWRSRPRPIAGWDGRREVYVLGRSGGVRKLAAFSRKYYLVTIAGMWWGRNDELFAEVMGSRGVGGPDHWWLEEVNAMTDRVVRRYRWAGGDLGGYGSPCSFDRNRTEVLCVAQTLTRPPVLVAVDLDTGSITRIVSMDTTQKPLRFSFRAVRIENRFGNLTTGFLALPSGAKKRAVPLAVMAYGFTEAYSKDAQWITSYPIAPLIHAGIAVLMVNWAHIPGLRSRGFGSERRIMEGAVSTLESALPAVRAIGVRISRAMIMGWSFGGLFVAHVIESDPQYVAAQVGDPADWNSTEYALGNKLWRTVSRWGLGGPPVRRYIRNYVDMDPAGSGKPPRGPVLIEFVSRNPAAGQLIEEWRAAGADLEAFVYHHSFHWLNVPAEARISRLRNLYWAKLNLLGPESVSCVEIRSVGLSVPAKGWWTARRPAGGRQRSVAECRCRTRTVPNSQQRRRKVGQRPSLHRRISVD